MRRQECSKRDFGLMINPLFILSTPCRPSPGIHLQPRLCTNRFTQEFPAHGPAPDQVTSRAIASIGGLAEVGRRPHAHR